MNEYHISHKLRHDHEQAARSERNARFLEALHAGHEKEKAQLNRLRFLFRWINLLILRVRVSRFPETHACTPENARETA